jgi:hypothetical protein
VGFQVSKNIFFHHEGHEELEVKRHKNKYYHEEHEVHEEINLSVTN